MRCVDAVDLFSSTGLVEPWRPVREAASITIPYAWGLSKDMWTGSFTQYSTIRCSFFTMYCSCDHFLCAIGARWTVLSRCLDTLYFKTVTLECVEACLQNEMMDKASSNRDGFKTATFFCSMEGRSLKPKNVRYLNLKRKNIQIKGIRTLIFRVKA